MFAVSCIVYMLIIFCGKHCVVMADMKKEENLLESNFGHTENEWGTSEKIYCECPTCKDITKKGYICDECDHEWSVKDKK